MGATFNIWALELSALPVELPEVELTLPPVVEVEEVEEEEVPVVTVDPVVVEVTSLELK